MKILITGVAGFIGSHLAEKLLSKNFNVIGIDNFDDFYSKEIKEKNLKKAKSFSTFKFLEIDILSFSDLHKKIDEDVEIIIHLAAKAGVRQSIQHPTDFININIIGTHNVLRWMEEKKCNKLIFASSSSVYGNNPIPFSENNCVDHPLSIYAGTKKSCELLNYSYHHLYDFSILNLRFFTVYGPRQRPDLAIHKFFNNIYNNKPIPIYGDGKTRRDYTYIDDIVNGIYSAIEYMQKQSAPVYDILNLGNNNPIELLELIHVMEEVTGKSIHRRYFPLPKGDVNYTYADIDKAQKLLNYKPNTTLRDGIFKFKTWFEQMQCAYT